MLLEMQYGVGTGALNQVNQTSLVIRTNRQQPATGQWNPPQIGWNQLVLLPECNYS